MKIKPLLLLSLLAVGQRVAAADFVVFGEHNFFPVGPGTTASGPMDPAERAFYADSSADLALPPAYEKKLRLGNPPAWGKTVSPGTQGVLRFHPAFARGFECHLALEGLLPSHDYILTLNGNPKLAGNSLLLSLVPGMEQERYYDFLIITTDRQGRYDAGFGIYLRAGKYNVRCYVKDTADFKIVLYHDYFPFTVW